MVTTSKLFAIVLFATTLPASRTAFAFDVRPNPNLTAAQCVSGGAGQRDSSVWYLRFPNCVTDIGPSRFIGLSFPASSRTARGMSKDYERSPRFVVELGEKFFNDFSRACMRVRGRAQPSRVCAPSPTEKE